MAGRNVFTVLETTAEARSHSPALHQPDGSNPSGFRSYSWSEWRNFSAEIACGLFTLGLERGQLALTLSETRAEFFLVDLGVMAAGGVSGALYTAYPMADLALNLRQTHPDFFFVEDAGSFRKIVVELERIGEPVPRHVFLMTGAAVDGATTLDDLRRLGHEALVKDPGLFQRLQSAINPGDPAILYLTSGATGAPKLSLASHAALLANLDMAPQVLPIGPDDSTLVFLPSAHIVQRVVLELVPMRLGLPVWFSEGLARMPNELRTVRPTFFVAPPRVWERVYSSVQVELRKRPPLLQKLFSRALQMSRRSWEKRAQGRPVPFYVSASLHLADRLFFRKIRERLGGRIRLAISGAAPLGRDLAEFFQAVGLPLIEGYGVTEAGVLSFNPVGAPRLGSVGKLLPGIEGRLGPDKELLIKSPCLFNGYYQDEEATRSVMTDDGWFATGDLADVDADGFWYITGRKKELIVSSNGKKIYPSRIEGFFKTEPVINQVVLVGDKRPFMTALITVNAGERNEAKPDDAVKEAVARVNRQLADFERIRRFRIVDREFSIQYGELTPTMKIRRAQVLENHKELVSELYLGRADSE